MTHTLNRAHTIAYKHNDTYIMTNIKWYTHNDTNIQWHKHNDKHARKYVHARNDTNIMAHTHTQNNKKIISQKIKNIQN